MREITIERNRGYYGKFRTLKLFADNEFITTIKSWFTLNMLRNLGILTMPMSIEQYDINS